MLSLGSGGDPKNEKVLGIGALCRRLFFKSVPRKAIKNFQREHVCVKKELVTWRGATPGPSNPIPGSFFEPLTRSWSHFVGHFGQKLSKSSKLTFD